MLKIVIFISGKYKFLTLSNKDKESIFRFLLYLRLILLIAKLNKTVLNGIALQSW
ncbi:Uncharacterised protein, partial [Mesomycoplasma hyorhinis]